MNCNICDVVEIVGFFFMDIWLIRLCMGDEFTLGDDFLCPNLVVFA